MDNHISGIQTPMPRQRLRKPHDKTTERRFSVAASLPTQEYLFSDQVCASASGGTTLDADVFSWDHRLIDHFIVQTCIERTVGNGRTIRTIPLWAEATSNGSILYFILGWAILLSNLVFQQFAIFYLASTDQTYSAFPSIKTIHFMMGSRAETKLKRNGWSS